MALNGKLLRLYMNGTAITNATESSISFSKDTRDASNKDTAGWKVTLSGLKSASVSTSALSVLTGDVGRDQLFAAFESDSTVTLRFSTDNTGEKEFTGPFILTSLEENAPNEDNVTLSASFESAGAVTLVTIT